MSFNKGDKVKFKKGFASADKDIYTFIGNCMSKNPDSGRMFSAVMYSKKGIIYVREKYDFYRSFEKV